MAESDKEDQTEDPTSKKLRESREKGQVARSRELGTFLMMMAGSVTLLLTGSSIYEGLAAGMQRGLSVRRETIFDANAMLTILGGALADVTMPLIPLFAVTVAVALVSPLLLGGWLLSFDALGFNFSRLNPWSGLKKLFGLHGLMELGKAATKFTIVLGGGAGYIWFHRDEILGLGREAVNSGIFHAFELAAWTFIAASSTLLVIVAVDVPFQLWSHNRQLRMTKQEVKDEYKDSEGKPEIKRKVRQAQMDISQRRMMSKVPQADVVITNPTHYAVALKYDPKTMAAPLVVAKGKDLIAAEIRRVAVESRVMLTSAPPLARAIFYTTELDKPVPAGLYKAVAMVLAYVYQIKRKRWTYSERPLVMDDLPIPDDLRRDK